MLKKSYYKRKEDDIKILIAEAKTRNNLTNKELAKRIGIPLSTLGRKIAAPGDFRCSELWLLEGLAGKEQT